MRPTGASGERAGGPGGLLGPPGEIPLSRPRATTFVLALVVLYPLGLVAQALSVPAGLAWTELAVFLLPAVALVARQGLSPLRFLRLVPAPTARGLGLGLVVGLLGILVAAAVQATWTPLLPERLRQAADVGRIFDEPGLGRWVVVLGAAALAPVCEEIAFRGHLLSALSLRFRPREAIGLSALAFAALHLDPVRFPALFLLGLLYGWLAWRTGSLYPAVLAHAVNNAAATAEALSSSRTPDGGATGAGAALTVLLLAGAPLAAVMAWAQLRTWPTAAPEDLLLPGRASPGRFPAWTVVAAMAALLLLGLMALCSNR
jgi:uncharacterized protein